MSAINDAEQGVRLRLMSYLALYNLLPYSILHPPHGRDPISLDEAIGADAVRLCLYAIENSHPSRNLAQELRNILRPAQPGSSSTGQSNGQGGNRGQSQSGNAYYGNYSTSTSQSHWTR